MIKIIIVLLVIKSLSEPLKNYPIPKPIMLNPLSNHSLEEIINLKHHKELLILMLNLKVSKLD